MLEVTHILNVSTPAFNNVIEKGMHTYPASSEWVLMPSFASLRQILQLQVRELNLHPMPCADSPVLPDTVQKLL